VDALIEQAASGGGYLGELLLLFAIPFLNENIAILVGNLFVHEYGMPPSLSVAAVFAGMLASDFSLYAAGRLASRSRWLGERLSTDRLRRLRAWIEAHATSLIVLARILPGLMPPLYLACGVIRLSFRRFALLTLATATIYLPLAFALVWVVGGATLSQFGVWAWGATILAFSAVALGRRAGGVWERAMRFSRHGAAAAGRPPPPVPPTGDSHDGMPSLEGFARTIAPAERIPEPLFYLPLALNWVRLALRYGSLSLPTAANPMIEAGGLWGESKTDCLDMVSGEARRWIAPYVTLTCKGNDAAERARAAAAMAEAGLGFPVVVKPDVGWHGVGVQLLRDTTALGRYLARFPIGLRYMLQQPLDWEGEAGVLYARRPGEAKGRVLSLTLRYHPHVVGDGATRLRDLILASERPPGRRGSISGSRPCMPGRARRHSSACRARARSSGSAS
jgi:membrane protein DedA with SNARE-associated domain